MFLNSSYLASFNPILQVVKLGLPRLPFISVVYLDYSHFLRFEFEHLLNLADFGLVLDVHVSFGFLLIFGYNHQPIFFCFKRVLILTLLKSIEILDDRFNKVRGLNFQIKKTFLFPSFHERLSSSHFHLMHL